MFEYGVALHRKYGPGTAAFLDALSRNIEPWSTLELQQLRSAARMGYQVYSQLYWELRPTHYRRPAS